MTWASPSPLKGFSPVRRKNSVTPSDQMSLRQSTLCASSCSGARKLSLPFTWPVLVRVSFWVALAMPKSLRNARCQPGNRVHFRHATQTRTRTA